MPVWYLNWLIQYSTIWLSKSSPPKCIIPLCDLTVISPSSNSNKVTSKVPPPKSNTKIFFVSLLFSFCPTGTGGATSNVLKIFFILKSLSINCLGSLGYFPNP